MPKIIFFTQLVDNVILEKLKDNITRQKDDKIDINNKGNDYRKI